MPASLSLEPIVGVVCGGSFAPNAPNGRYTGCEVFTAKSPHATVTVNEHFCVHSRSRMIDASGDTYSGYCRWLNVVLRGPVVWTIPLRSSTECRSAPEPSCAAPGTVGVAAA